MSALSIGVDFMQILSIFVSFDFQWPPVSWSCAPPPPQASCRCTLLLGQARHCCAMTLVQVLVKLLHAISVFNFNLELLSLECSVSVNFTTRWYVVLF